jgi:alkylated DNA repair dioxygenase AlkB
MEPLSFLEPKLEKILDQDGIVYYQDNFIRDISVTDLIDEIKWNQDEIKMFGKTHLLPRLTAFQGDPGVRYAYSGIKMVATPFTKNVLAIKELIESNFHYQFNSVLINYYRHGNDHMSYHADDEIELGRNPTIASISLGDSRKFTLKHRWQKELKPFELLLHDKSLLIMTGELQHYWLHKISKKTASTLPRINLTFRKLS